MASSRLQRFYSDPASFIDHTILKPNATRDDVVKLCAEAAEYGFATVCVNSRHIPLCVEHLKDCKTIPIAVVGFPLGACSTEAKVFETEWSIKHGAKEIDMVIDIGSLLSGDSQAVKHDIEAVVKAASPLPVKVIIETCLLPTVSVKEEACRLAVSAGAAFVKTSTGFSTGGATVEDIKLMRRTVGDGVGVKASGGVRSWQDAVNMVEAGASRIGASSSVALIKEYKIHH